MEPLFPRAKRRRIGTARRGRQSDSCAYDDATQSGWAASTWGQKAAPAHPTGPPNRTDAVGWTVRSRANRRRSPRVCGRAWSRASPKAPPGRDSGSLERRAGTDRIRVSRERSPTPTAAGDRARRSDSERASRRPAGGRGPHEHRGGAGTVRDREDRRHAPVPRLPKTRHHLTTSAVSIAHKHSKRPWDRGDRQPASGAGRSGVNARGIDAEPRGQSGPPPRDQVGRSGLSARQSAPGSQRASHRGRTRRALEL